tara:strand:- start:91 stop:888 length:798 start_codon:yes stop_codon:yes gene_type:complete
MNTSNLPKQSCTLIAALSLTASLQAATVFQTGFDYASAPTLTTDGSSLNGATGQIGTFSGAMRGPGLTTGGALRMDGRGTGSGDWTLTATLSETIAFDGSTVSFDFGNFRTGSHVKDNTIIGFDSFNVEVFRLVLSAVNTAGEGYRIGTSDGTTTTWDLTTTVGTDADNDLPAFQTEPSGTISMVFSSTGYILSLDGANDYTTSEITFSAGIDLAYLEFRGQSGGSNSTDGGMILDNISVAAVPEPSTTALLGLGGLALILRRRK